MPPKRCPKCRALLAEGVSVCTCGFKVSWDEGAPPEVVATATAFRRLVLLVGSQVFLGIAGRMVRYAVPREETTARFAVSCVVFVVVAGLSIAQLVTAYRLAQGIGERAAWALAAVMCIPCLNVLMLLLLTSRATAWCRQHGIGVGLLGPSAATIEKLELGTKPRGAGLGLHT